MPKELQVRYNNYMNKLSFKGFTEKDFDLFMAICARMKDLGDKEQTFEYDYLMDLMKWDKSKSISEFHNLLKRMVNKLRTVGTTLEDEDDDVFVAFNLFSTFEGSKKKRLLKVQTNNKFIGILNDYLGHYTGFELKEYISLEGRYTKQLYQQLRQRYIWQGHFWNPTIEEFRKVLSIPEKLKVKDITRDIVNHSVEIIKSCKGFKELKVEVIKAKRRGSPVIGYKFTWTEKGQITGQLHLDDIDYDEPQQKNTRKEKPKRTKFSNFDERDYSESDLEEIARKKMEKQDKARNNRK